MAQLNNIIGAILRDVAQARMTSDIYSREVSKYYEEDHILRLFPVPRSEIREINLDLRFSIADVDIGPELTQERDARVSLIFDRYSLMISDGIFEDLRGSSRTDAYKDETWQKVVTAIDTADRRQELRGALLKALEDNVRTLLTPDDKTGQLLLNRDDAQEMLLDVLTTVIYDLPEVKEAELEESTRTSYQTYVANGLKDRLMELSGSLKMVGESRRFNIDVDVAADKLVELPESAISSVHLTTVVRNYQWSQVEEKDGRPVHRLVPE